MGKLHELLAVETELRNMANQAHSAVTDLFKSGTQRFIGASKRYHPLEEGGQPLEDEDVELATTIGKELDGYKNHFVRYVDATIQKEVTNMETNAELNIGESVLTLPAPALLNLESRLQELRRVLVEIPTLDPSEFWTWNDDNECYVSRTRTTYRTKKVPKAHVLYEATKEHPAQVEAFTEDIRVGQWETIIQSGMITNANKNAMVNRIDELIREVKMARQRANNIDVNDIELAELIYDYVVG